jgi:ADP-heptose:LPS heptosyltransferase
VPLTPDVRQIAVLRANGIGDLMFALPALESLRAAYPNAKITLLATPWHRSFLQGRPGPVDDVVVVPVSKGVREVPGVPVDEAELEEFFAKMRERSFDLALQMHGGGGNSNPLLKRLGAQVTAGLRAEGAERLDLEVPYIYYQSEVMRLLEVAGLVGARPVTFEPRLEVTAYDLAEAASLLPEGGPLAVLHPGAGDPRRRWPIDRFARVGDELARAGATVAVVGGRDDSELSKELLASMRRSAVDLAGRIGLGGLAGLLSRCNVLVSNDSGPLHVGAAVGAATVGIYWCGNLINAGLPFRARHRPLISWRLTCPVCGADCTRLECPHEASFVADVPIEEVSRAALELYGQTLPTQASGLLGTDATRISQ